MRWYVSLVALLVGCNKLFGIDEVKLLDAAPDALFASCVPPMSQDGDDDGDGVKNKDDKCPYVANAKDHDEDKDGFLDACDPCAEAKDSNAPDADCDGLDAACDLHDSIPSDREFYGFGDFDGLMLTSSTVSVADKAHHMFTNTLSMEVSTNQVVPAGVYDTHFSFMTRNPAEKFSVGLSFVAGGNTYHAYVGAGTTGNPGLFIDKGITNLKSMPFPLDSSAGSYTLRVVVTPTSIEAKVTGTNEAFLVAGEGFSTAKWGIEATVGSVPSAIAVDFDYMARTADR